MKLIRTARLQVGGVSCDLRQEVEHGDEEIGGAEVTDHGVHAAEVLASRQSREQPEHQSVAAQSQHQDDRLHADLGADEGLVPPSQRRPRRLPLHARVCRHAHRRRVPLRHLTSTPG